MILFIDKNSQSIISTKGVIKITLFVVATPIGNLEDMTPRAVRVLQEVDIIAAEDTRHSHGLLTHFDIAGKPMFSLHKFNEEKRGDFFVSKLREGKTVALISDAGTPCISDPGYRLVKMAADAGVDIVAVCGASAVVAALSVSGFDVSRFQFLGFLPRKRKDMTTILANTLPGTIVFYESPKRVLDTLKLVAENFPSAEVCICNDLSKKFEQSYRGNISHVLATLQENPNAEKGEYTCVIYCESIETDIVDETDAPSLESQLVDIMVKSGGNLKDAAAILRERHVKLSKKEIYSAMLTLKKLLMGEDDA